MLDKSIEYNNMYNNAGSLIMLAGGSITSGGSGLPPLAYSTNVSNWTQFTLANSPFLSNDVINAITYNYNANISIVIGRLCNNSPYTT